MPCGAASCPARASDTPAEAPARRWAASPRGHRTPASRFLQRRPAHPVRERLRLRAGRTAAAFRCVRAASPPSAGHRVSPASIPCSACFHPSPACRVWSVISTKCAHQPPPSAQAESAAATARPAVDCPAAQVRVQGYSSADSLPARATVRGMACWSVRVKPMSRPSPAKARVLATATGRARETAKPMA